MTAAFGLLAALLLLPTALAVRSVDLDLNTLTTANQGLASWSFSGNPGKICGGAGIWKELTKGEKAQGSFRHAQNINWPYMEAIKKEFLESKASFVTSLEERLKKLSADYERALQEESLPYTAEAEHKALILAGIEGGGYGGIEAASTYQCGGQRRKVNGQRAPKAVRGAFERSLPVFDQAGRDFFNKKTHRLDDMAFLQTCKSLLITENAENAEDPHHWCGQLCQQYKDFLQSASSSASGEVAHVSNKIKEEIEESEAQLVAAKAEIAQCQVEWASLEEFKGALEGLKETYAVRHEAFRNCDATLKDLEFELENIEDDIEESEGALAKAAERLSEAGKVVAKATQALKDAGEACEIFKGKVKGLEGELEEVKDGLTKARGAHDMVGKLKEKVAKTMMLMMQLVEGTIREPLFNLGFSEDPEDLDFAPPGSTDAAPVLKQAVASMRDYCDHTATPAFDRVKELLGEPDLSPLCKFNSAEAVYEDLEAQVSKRMKAIKRDLLMVVSWLNPWRANKGKTMADAEKYEEELVSKGQLACLEQVKGVYTEPSNAFFKYLIGWRKDGPHHKLYAELEKAIELLEKKEQEFTKALKEATEEAERAKQAYLKAEVELGKAKEDEGVAEAEKKAIEETLEKLREEWEKTSKAVAEWQEKTAKALEALQAARAALEEAYHEGTTQKAAA